MKKLERIHQQEQKTRDKIAALQAILKDIDGQRTEQENLQIIQKFRALKLSRDELYTFLGGGELPPIFADMFSSTAEPESIYSQSNRKRRNKRDDVPEDTTDTETTEDGDESTDQEGSPYSYTDTTENTYYESEGLNYEE